MRVREHQCEALHSRMKPSASDRDYGVAASPRRQRTGVFGWCCCRCWSTRSKTGTDEWQLQAAGINVFPKTQSHYTRTSSHSQRIRVGRVLFGSRHQPNTNIIQIRARRKREHTEPPLLFGAHTTRALLYTQPMCALTKTTLISSFSRSPASMTTATAAAGRSVGSESRLSVRLHTGAFDLSRTGAHWNKSEMD